MDTPGPHWHAVGDSCDREMKPSSSADIATLAELLKERAVGSPCNLKSLLIYPSGNTTSPITISYVRLLALARQNALVIRSRDSFQIHKPILLHTDNHWDAILWFWSIILANGIPVLSTPLSNAPEHRKKHIKGLSSLLESPICITRARNVPLFDGAPQTLQIHTIEGLDQTRITQRKKRQKIRHCGQSDALAMLMLTSGSTGSAKAVCITHKMALASVAGKAGASVLPPDRPFLNWISIDHVGALVEIHLHALWENVDQIHVDTADIVSSPTVFLDLLSRHRVLRSFAPNFFLASLVSTSQNKPHPERTWDLSNLRFLVSGGEANDMQTCVEASSLLETCGAPRGVIAPGFGMTETCAGSIYNTDCPNYDLGQRYNVASLGRCIKGMEMRVQVSDSDNQLRRNALPNEPGDLEVRGTMVFRSYYKNAAATKEAFTSDGWFRTGDRAFLDPKGHLCLAGRVKELMAQIDRLLTQACLLATSSRPLIFAIGPESLHLLPTTTLGKISRAKMRSLFEQGCFETDVALYRSAIESATKRHQQQEQAKPLTETEACILQDLASIQNATGDDKPTVNLANLDIDAPMWELGFTSMDLIRLKHALDKRWGISLPVVTLMKNPTARSLASVLEEMMQARQVAAPPTSTTTTSAYDPVITFRPPPPKDTKPPLWLIHPGVGEILVFIPLIQHLSSGSAAVPVRPKRQISSVAEAVERYVSAIRSHQPEGPYCLAGYSYGSMLAFEIAKVLEGDNQEVKCLGVLNLPPRIKERMRHLNWNRCLLNLAYFLGLVKTEEDVTKLDGDVAHLKDKARALEIVLGVSEGERLAELGLDEEALVRWADVAFGLQSMAVDYEPAGKVKGGMDIFYAVPLKAVARSKEEWLEGHLYAWREFADESEGVRFHAVDGAHYTMIAPRFVKGFAEVFATALRDRGV
ncbi:acyl-coenzyme A synthetases/AMP-acid ligase [Cladorrhinum sp. PSN259]|nr:acyl-coenzyme A synthetases/AMP-acid ligase [Cladorrhinum sp. PSN259]